jgi:hypothetical protein
VFDRPAVGDSVPVALLHGEGASGSRNLLRDLSIGVYVVKGPDWRPDMVVRATIHWPSATTVWRVRCRSSYAVWSQS